MAVTSYVLPNPVPIAVAHRDDGRRQRVEKALGVGLILLVGQTELFHRPGGVDHAGRHRLERPVQRDRLVQAHRPTLLHGEPEFGRAVIQRANRRDHGTYRGRDAVTHRLAVHASVAQRLERFVHILGRGRLVVQLERHPHQHRTLEHHEEGMHDHHGMTADGVIQEEDAHPHALQDMEADVMHRDRDGRGHDHAPIAVHQQKGERGEHVKVRFDHAVGLMNEHPRVRHEANANGDARQGGAGSRSG